MARITLFIVFTGDGWEVYRQTATVDDIPICSRTGRVFRTVELARIWLRDHPEGV